MSIFVLPLYVGQVLKQGSERGLGPKSRDYTPCGEIIGWVSADLCHGGDRVISACDPGMRLGSECMMGASRRCFSRLGKPLISHWGIDNDKLLTTSVGTEFSSRHRKAWA